MTILDCGNSLKLLIIEKSWRELAKRDYTVLEIVLEGQKASCSWQSGKKLKPLGIGVDSAKGEMRNSFGGWQDQEHGGVYIEF